MSKLFKKIELQDGDWYELYETGKTYKSVYTSCDGLIVEEKKHSHLQAALNNRHHKYFVKMEKIESEIAELSND